MWILGYLIDKCKLLNQQNQLNLSLIEKPIKIKLICSEEKRFKYFQNLSIFITINYEAFYNFLYYAHVITSSTMVLLFLLTFIMY